MTKKKILAYILIVFIIGIFTTNTCKAQDDWGDMDPGGSVPLPGAVYFLIVALGIGAKKLYDANKNASKQDEF